MSSISQQSDLVASLKLTPEEKLLILCARLSLAHDQRDELTSLLLGPLDWDQVVYKSQWHSLTGLVFHHLHRLEQWSLVPPGAKEQLKAAYLANIARNLYFQEELRKALEGLHRLEIPVILLKGAALVKTVYGDIGLRPMADLDLLVPEEWLHDAQAVVRGLGYLPVGSPAEQDDTEKNHRHMPGLMGVGKPVLFEIHRHVVRRDSGLHFDISGFWSRAQEISVADKKVLVLAPEDLLIHLSLNFFLDRRFRSLMALRQLCDIAETIRYYQDSIRWQLFTDKVREYGQAGPVGSTLHLAQELLDVRVPCEAALKLWPQGFDATQMKRFLRRRVLDTQEWVARSLATPGSNYRPGSVALAALRRLVPSRSYMARQYHRSNLGAAGHLLYLARLWDGLLIFFRAASRAREMKEDLAIDRWHHSLYENRNY